jgi:hypothetical protein
MFKSSFDRARIFTKQLFGLKQSTPRPQQAARTRLTLEPLEERTLLSASGNEPNVPSPLMEAGRYAVQEAMNYLSNYESTLAMMQRMVTNLEQQALLTVTRMEETAALRVEQFIQQFLYPTTTESNSIVQSSSMAPVPPGG